ncbi:hypothetical protein RF11_12227 [Thelohanellus kitauei]|uniref:Galactosyltransferase C-terminal domain-containing protein n=1 Tax=Thelohanellus kitauei TaxID=669202 RepID=A0A0C2MMJ7_THEKT|nr:hypothetical protein RF11_12227 [Thelohanellus kitauei]
MSNDYWGWGREDDDLKKRFQREHIPIRREIDFSDSKPPYFIHDHPIGDHRDFSNLAHNTEVFNFFILILKSKRFNTGLSTLKYKLVRVNIQTINNVAYTYIKVELNCQNANKKYVHPSR